MTSPRTRQRAGVALGVGAGLAIGIADRGATEVQGAVLLVMLAACAVAFASDTPAWLAAAAVGAGVFATQFAGGIGSTNWVQLIAVLPAAVGAYGGKALSAVIRASSNSLVLPREDTTTTFMATWYDMARSPATLLGLALLASVIVGALPVYATFLARGKPLAWWLTAVWQVITLIAWALALNPLLNFWRKAHVHTAGGVAARDCVVTGSLVIAITLAHTIALPLITRALYIPLGGTLAEVSACAFAVYLPLDALTYGLIIGLGYASDTTRSARAAAARESAVRGELASARLASLRAQLRPHFLFNALNAASVLTRRGDTARAEHVLNELGELLRYVLRGADVDAASDANEFIPLSSEVDFAEAYLAIERERFPDRLAASIDIDPALQASMVPHLILQPIVENAVRHGVGGRIGLVTIAVRAIRIADALILIVEDDGPGITPRGDTPSSRAGIGIANSRARLAAIYGEKAELTIAARPSGGTEVRIAIPIPS